MDIRYVELAIAKEAPADRTSVWYILLLGAVALTSGMANGYNGTVLEGTIPRLQYWGQLKDPVEMGAIEGAMSVGGLLGSLACTELANVLSRRRLVIIGEAAIALGVLIFAFTTHWSGSFAQALAGRTLTGLGVGVCGLAKPLIVSELAPPHKRGLLVAFFSVGQSIGMNVFYVTDLALPPPSVDWAWRVLVALGATPAFVVMILACVFQENGEYWDVPPREQQQTQSSGGSSAEGALAKLKRMLTAEPPEVRRNFSLILAMMIGYNLSGTLIISNYASDILSDTTRRLPIVIGLVQLLGLLSAASLTDRVGRRPLLLGSCIVTVVGLFSVASMLFSTQADVSLSGGGAELWILLALMVLVEFAVGVGLNPIRVILSAELMPNAYRSLGMSLGNATGWLLALISLFLYPVVASAAGGPAPQFAFFGCVVAALLALLVWQLPETNGISLGAQK